MAPRGQGLFALYVYSENFKQLLLQNYWPDFEVIWHSYSLGGPLPRLFKLFRFVKKMAARGRGLFALYVYNENFKQLLLQNYWPELKVICHRGSFGGPLPRLCKFFGFVKKHGRQGAGLICLICI